MDFETLWSRYRSGTASDEEVAQVEAELEKFRLLEACIEEERPPLPPPDTRRLQEELRRARRQVRRRTARVAVGVLAAVLALGLLAQLVLFPAINRRAVKVDWSDQIKVEDPANLPATMMVFTALHAPRARFSAAYAERSGFGSEKLDIRFYDKNGLFSITASMTLGVLHVGIGGDVERLSEDGLSPYGDFIADSSPETSEILLRQARETLATLPGGVEVYAAVRFREQLTLAQLTDVLNEYDGGDLDFMSAHVCLAAVRIPVYLTLSSGGIWPPDQDSVYPDLAVYGKPFRTDNLQQALEGRLQFMADHTRLAGLFYNLADDPAAGYAAALQEVQTAETAVDGAYVTASPAALLRLIDSGLVEGVGLKDADFDLS